VLIIDRNLPHFDRDAGARAAWQYIELLSGMGFRITLLGDDFQRHEPYARLLENMGVETVSGGALICGRWRDWIRTRSDKFDYALLYRPEVAITYIDFLRRSTRAKILYFGVDLCWLRNQRRYEVESNPSHLAATHYWHGVENRLISMSDATYFYSCVESDIMSAEIPSARIRTIPLFIFRSESKRSPGFEEREGLLFVGGFAHQPNMDGILWFLNEIFPLIREQIGEITLYVVGDTPPEQLRGVQGIVLTGSMSEVELQALYRQIRVVIAPLRYGAGIKGKVVEAVFEGVPVVTTSIGAEGLPESNSVLEISDTPCGFAAATALYYQDKNLWSARSISMRSYAEKHFSAETARQILEKDLSP
jgi:glycosyltransferase involved in cell wall biosynthesis